jgi:UDP-glucose 4-epimerase
MAALNNNAYGQLYNVGIDQPSTFRELAENIVRISGTGRWEYAPFTPERAAQEPGDFYSDITKIRQQIGWQPQTSLEDGLTATIDYYRKHRHHYW